MPGNFYRMTPEFEDRLKAVAARPVDFNPFAGFLSPEAFLEACRSSDERLLADEQSLREELAAEAEVWKSAVSETPIPVDGSNIVSAMDARYET